MAQRNKKKLSLSERFGTIGPVSVDYDNKARTNSEMVSKLHLQITEVVRKRTEVNARESQAKMISEEISDVQHRFDDAPVACQKFIPFKVELKVNRGNKHAEQQKDNDRNVSASNAGNMEGLCDNQSNKTSHNEERGGHGNGVEPNHDSGLEHDAIKGCGSKNISTSMTATGFRGDEPKIKNNVKEFSGKCRNDERDMNIQPSPTVYQDTSYSDTHQPYDVELNSKNKWLQKNCRFNSPKNTVKSLPTVQEQPKKNQNRSPGNIKTFQSREQNSNAGHYAGSSNKEQKAEFNKTNHGQPIFNFNNSPGVEISPKQGSKASPNFNKRQSSKTSPNFNKRQSSKTSPNFNKEPRFQNSQNFNTGQGCKTSPNFNTGPGCKTSPHFNMGPGCKASPNFNKGQGFQTSPNFNKGQGFQTSPNFNKGQGFQTSPDFNKSSNIQASKIFSKGQGIHSSPNFNTGPGCKASPNFNTGPGYKASPNLNTKLACKASPNLNKGQCIQTSHDFNISSNIQANKNSNGGQGIHTSPTFDRRPGFQATPNLSKGQNFQVQDVQTRANKGLCSEVNPNLNKGQEFQGISNLNKGKGFQANPSFIKVPGFQTSPDLDIKQNNASKSFGCNTFELRNTNVRQHYEGNASDDPGAIYDIQDQFYNYQTNNRFPKGRQQRTNFHNKTGFGGHLINQQGSFSSNPPPHHQARPGNPATSCNNMAQPPVYSPSKQLYNAGVFGKRHASSLASNKYIAPAKKRMLATDQLNEDIPSFQNRLPYTEKNLSSNPPWQGNHCDASSYNSYAGNRNLPYGHYPGHILNTPFQPPVAGNYGLALHGPFTPKTWNVSHQNASTQNYIPTLESANTLATHDNKFHHLNKSDDLSSTKHYLFNKMLDQNDTMRPTDVLKPTGNIVKPLGDVKPTGNIVKPTGFYQEITNGSLGSRQKEKEETELVSTLLTQCQAMAQKDDDRQALHTIFNIIHQEMGHQPLQASVKSKIPSTDRMPELTRNTSEASLYGEDAKFSPTSSSPDASKQNGNNRFEGRTLLKGGVKPRHIPKTLVNKQDDDPPRDPRSVKDCKTKSLMARKMKDLPLPPFFIEFVATEKFGKKKSDDVKPNQALKQKAEKNMSEESNSFIPSTGFETKRKDFKIGMGKTDDLNLESNIGIKQQQTALGNLIAETKIEQCGPDVLETRKSDVISHILPLITVRRMQGESVTDDTALNKEQNIDVCCRDPRLRATSISKKRDDNPIVDLPVLNYEECRVGKQHEAPDDGCEKALECVIEPKQTQCGGYKGRNEAYLLTNVSRDGLQSRERNSPLFHKDAQGRETNIRSGDERSSQHNSGPKDTAKHFSGKLPAQQRRYSGSGNGSTQDIDRFSSSPSRRLSRFSSEQSLIRSRSNSRSRGEEWTEKEVTVRRTNRVSVSHENMCQSQSFERNTVVYSKDRHSEHYRNQFQERNEHDRRNSMSPGTCRYLKRRDLERRNTPPSSINRNEYRNRYQGRRNRNYSEGSDYPESCSSPLR